jgi:drug/metabolite transporter (DMT)-like permease
MPVTSFVLVLVAALMHALWNAMAKRARDKFLFLWCSASIAALFLLPAIIVDGIRGALPGQGWLYVFLSITIHAVYFYALGRAYKTSAYPLVLFAFQMAKTGYVVAGREMSIIFSVLIGAIWLKESKFAVRMTGAAAILCGVALIAFS